MKFTLLDIFVKKRLAPALIFAYVTSLHKTCKVEIIGAEHIQPYIDQQQPMLPCYWHQQMIFSVGLIRGLCQQGVKAKILVSPSKDGDIGEAVLNALNVGVLRGSAHRTGAVALRDIYLAISKEQSTVGAAVDGPLGPAREAKVGAITLAQLSGAPIIPIVNACSKKKYLSSWDKIFLPYPFSRVKIIIGQPIIVAKRASAEEIEELQQQLTDQLNQLSIEAEKAFS